MGADNTKSNKKSTATRSFFRRRYHLHVIHALLCGLAFSENAMQLLYLELSKVVTVSAPPTFSAANLIASPSFT